MKAYPHHYSVKARGSASGAVPVTSQGLPELATAPPPEFDGPGGTWSPETLLVAAIADCFILTFRGVSRAAKFPWERLECEVEGVLDKVAGVTQFCRYTTRATLTVVQRTDQAKAHELLERAEKVCLVANSLRGERSLEVRIAHAAT